ncbi:MAG: 4-hydroxy-tetrahydrodipicolinate synthase [bacterium]
MFNGSMVALITPLKDDEIDEEGLRRLVNYEEENGIDVLVPCGTTGESATLTHEEHNQVIEIVADEASRARVMAGTGSNSTHEAIGMSRHAEEVGCDALLVITPYYNKPPQRGMQEHYLQVADEVNTDIILYNVPSRTGINLEAATVVSLAEHPNIIGVKEASGDLGQVSEIITNTPDDFAVLSGDDSLTLPIMSVGGAGVVSVIANIVPGRVSELVHSFQQGDYRRAREIHQEIFPLMQAMFWETNPVPVKAAASKIGLCRNELRSPMPELAPDLESDLGSLLSSLEIDIND